MPMAKAYILFSLLFFYGGLGTLIGFLRLGFSVDRVWGLWCGVFWVYGDGALYINIGE